MPGQLRRPTPKGMKRKSLPLASTFDSSSRNRSGRNCSGFFHWAGVDEDLALRGDFVASQLGVVEIHVGDEERDGHAQPEGFFYDCLEVGELVGVGLCDLVAAAKDCVEFFAKLALDFRVESHIFHLLADLEISPQERPENGDKISIVVLEALREATPLVIKGPQLHEKGIVLALKPSVEHDAVHIVVHHKLQAAADHNPLGGRLWVFTDILNDACGLIFPPIAVLLHDLVSEEGDGHYAAHLPPMLAVYSEDHILALSSEDIKDDVASSGTKLDSLGVEDLTGKIRRRDDNEIALAHSEEKDIAELLGQGCEIAVIEVVANLEPVAEDRHRKGPWRELELLPAELRDDDGESHCREEAE
ncbi:hypothetical protein IEQ34_005718 [Dendrobium chrysotoxum]|uniref:Uncharacterized protein n=1 Tax=Dendrobium chrysotoxum TaxID=161865 RepID=A0AAV7GUP1_DENCH|nr:hypothetical protein IEQ34_005718 [Dendrobium chrysotoxum]